MAIHHGRRRPTSARKQFHASMSPVVYSRHGREHLTRDIDRLAFPMEAETDLSKLASSDTVVNGLSLSDAKAYRLAKRDGITPETNQSVHHRGYGDRHFTGLIASTLGKDIAGALGLKLSMLDYAKMFQTGWFGNLLTQTALTDNGNLEPGCNGYPDPTGDWFQTLFKDLRTGESKIKGDAYDVRIDDVSGLAYVNLSREVRTVLRNEIPHYRSVGCPVAHSTSTVTADQLARLEARGHISDESHFQVEESEGNHIKLKQGPYNAIDEAAWQWGDYVWRYGQFLLNSTHQVDPALILETDANQSVLLD